MLALIALAGFVIFPLTLVGTVIGKNISGAPNFPCRVNAVPRPIPEKRWFMEPLMISILGGILPFGSIFIEMYFILTSFWAYKIYYVYGFILLVLAILSTVTICVTIVCTYFLLNSEDYRWHWTSFLSAASTAGYVYIYSIYYFLFKTRMYGLFQVRQDSNFNFLKVLDCLLLWLHGDVLFGSWFDVRRARILGHFPLRS
jgi:transmembrane 9 superfamily protein 3